MRHFKLKTGVFFAAVLILFSAGSTMAQNSPPELIVDPLTYGAEGALVSFDVSATDPDGPVDSIWAEHMPDWGGFEYFGGDYGTFSGIPEYDDYGYYLIRFIASDGELTDTTIVSVIIANSNEPPTITIPNDTIIDEGQEIVLEVSGIDPEGGSVSFSVEDGFETAELVDNGEGLAIYTATPGCYDAGIHNVRFIVTDSAGATDLGIVNITVNDVNAKPYFLTDDAWINAPEDTMIVFEVEAADSCDGTIPTITHGDMPDGATFYGGYGTGTFVWTPTFAQNGAYDIRFYASDGEKTDSIYLVIFVNETNEPPTITVPGSQAVDEMNTLTWTIDGYDPEGMDLNFAVIDGPDWGEWINVGSNSADYIVSPDCYAAGTYYIDFEICDQGGLCDTATVQLVVGDVNTPPHFATPVQLLMLHEMQYFYFPIVVADTCDSDLLTITYNSIPEGAQFYYWGTDTAWFVWTPDYDQGEQWYLMEFYVSDGEYADTMDVAIYVYNTNEPPTIIMPADTTIEEGQFLELTIDATDPEDDDLIYFVEEGPEWGSLADKGTGSDDWTGLPDCYSSGLHELRVIVSDPHGNSDTGSMFINVLNNNFPPQIETTDTMITSPEMDQIDVYITTSDSCDGGSYPVTWSELPEGATINQIGDIYWFAWVPTYEQWGWYGIAFYTDDGEYADTTEIAIYVTNSNEPVEIVMPPDTSVDEQGVIELEIKGRDPEGAVLSFTLDSGPAWGAIVGSTDTSVIYRATPGCLDVGTYPVQFTVCDPGDSCATGTFNLTVNWINNEPHIVTSDTMIQGFEGTNMVVGIYGTDTCDGTSPTITHSELPEGAHFFDFSGTAALMWYPSYTQAGWYDVWFYASDGELVDTTYIIYQIADVNAPPVIVVPADTSVDEWQLLELSVTATDVDETIPALTYFDLPIGAGFIDNGDGTGAFTWTPDTNQAGEHTVGFVASDGEKADTGYTILTINDINQPPVLIVPVTQTIGEDSLLTFTVSATDPEGGPIYLTAEDLPWDATFTDNGDGSGVFSGRPGWTDAETYMVTFIASDLALTDTKTVTIIVEDVNAPPIITGPSQLTGYEGELITYDVTATDVDGTIPTLYITATDIPLPVESLFVDNGDGTGTFAWTPHYDDRAYRGVLIVADDGEKLDTIITLINVLDGNEPPVIHVPVADTVMETQPISFLITATDPQSDTLPLTFTSPNLPAEATLTPVDDTSAEFFWTPNMTAGGAYSITFIVTDQGDPRIYADTGVTAVLVLEYDEPPEIFVPDTVIAEETVPFSFQVMAYDPNGQFMLMFPAPGSLPPWASYTAGLRINDTLYGTCYGEAPLDSEGEYPIEFQCADVYTLISDTTILVITHTNRAPVLDSIGPQATDEGVAISFYLTATDVEGQPISYTAENLPTGCYFNNYGTDSARFVWTPNYYSAGEYEVTFIADDGQLADSEVVLITVTNANGPPVMIYTAQIDVNEGDLMTFDIQVSDPDGDVPVLDIYDTAIDPGEILTLVPNGDSTVWTFAWQTDYNDAGFYLTAIRASDGQNVSYAFLWMNVHEDNQPPEIVVLAPAAGDLYNEVELTIAMEDATGLAAAYYQFDGCGGTWVQFWTDPGSLTVDTVLWSIPEGLSDGDHNLYLMVVDDNATGNIDSCTVKWDFTYDNTEPIVAVIAPETGEIYSALPELSVHMTDNIGLHILEYQLDGCDGSWEPIWATFTTVLDDTIQLQIPTVSNGTHTVYFRVTDMAGNLNADTCVSAWEFTFDDTPPTISVLSPASGLTYFSEQPIITIGSSDNVGLKYGYYQINGCDGVWIHLWGFNHTGTDTLFEYDTRFFPEGSYSLYFKVIDDAGNINIDSCSYNWEFTLTGSICCCQDMRGNVNCDQEDQISISDLTYLQSYLFANGPPPLCMEEANVDGSLDGVVDLNDLEVLINYMFYDGQAPALCPLCRQVIEEIRDPFK
ncbi:MAG: hypothetical protein GY841_17350 [FCB group bacterium]|nr:hypothetical protein [FCB group bacterium]